MDIETIFKFIQSMNGGSQNDQAQNMFKLLNQQSKDVNQNQNTTTSQSSGGGGFDFSKIMPLFNSKPDPSKIMQSLLFNMPQFKNMNNLFTAKTQSSPSPEIKTLQTNSTYKNISEYKKIE